MTKMKTYSKAKWKDPKSVCRLCLGAVKGGVPIFDPMFTPVYNFISCVLDVSVSNVENKKYSSSSYVTLYMNTKLSYLY